MDTYQDRMKRDARMAGDWIPFTKDLPKKLEILKISSELGKKSVEVWPYLLLFWSWADSQTEDGFLAGVSLSMLPAIIPGTGKKFWEAVSQTGWVTEDASGLKLKNFGTWMGKSAKSRLNKSRRQSRWRDGQQSTSVDASAPTRPSTRPSTEAPTTEQNRTEQINTNTADVHQLNGKPLIKPADSNLPCHNPDVFPEAKIVVDYFQGKVGKVHSRAGAEAEVIGLLKSGKTSEQLRKFVDNYAASCEREGKLPKFRSGPTAFFSEGWKDWQTANTKSPEELARIERVQRENAERLAHLENHRRAKQ